MSCWRKHIKDIEKLPVEKQRTGNYLLTNKGDIRNTGVFPVQQSKIENDILERRKKGEAVSTLWARSRITHHCEKDKPSGYNKNKHKFTEK